MRYNMARPSCDFRLGERQRTSQKAQAPAPACGRGLRLEGSQCGTQVSDAVGLGRGQVGVG